MGGRREDETGREGERGEIGRKTIIKAAGGRQMIKMGDGNGTASKKEKRR
jgi:hypothetical protein